MRLRYFYCELARFGSRCFAAASAALSGMTTRGPFPLLLKTPILRSGSTIESIGSCLAAARRKRKLHGEREIGRQGSGQHRRLCPVGCVAKELERRSDGHARDRAAD
jgi:hypothetical protein